MEHSMEEAMIYYERFEYLFQFHKDTLFDYWDRFFYVLKNAPENVNCYDVYGRPKDFLVEDFLNGLLPRERYMLDQIAGGSILNCTGAELWNLIYQRAMIIKLCGSEAQPFGTRYANFTRTYDKLEFYYERKVCLASERLTSESVQVSSNNIEMVVTTHSEEEKISDEAFLTLVEECVDDSDGQDIIVEDFPIVSEFASDYEEENKDVQDDTLVTELAECIDDQVFSSKDLIPLHCSDMQITQSTVSICTNSLPLVNDTLLCSSLQVVVPFPLIRMFLESEKSAHLLGLVATNWKKRKKVMHMNIRVAKCNKYLSSSQWSIGAKCLNWKRRKRKRHKLDGEKVSSYFWLKQQRSSTFRWKPGWNLKKFSYEIENVHGGCRARKFDGVHPWAPNI